MSRNERQIMMTNGDMTFPPYRFTNSDITKKQIAANSRNLETGALESCPEVGTVCLQFVIIRFLIVHVGVPFYNSI